MAKVIIYNDDGWSSYMRYPAPMSPEDIIRVTVGPVVGSGVGIYQFCSLGGHAVNYNSSFLPRVGEMMDSVDTMHVWRMRETLRALESLGTDPLRIVSAACHENGIACQFSFRVNDAHHTYKRTDGSLWFPELVSPWFDSHPDALLPGGQLDYAHQEVHDYRVNQIREILENYEVDGVDLDFTRFKPFFSVGEEKSGMPRMTELISRLRDLTAKYNKTLSARFEYDPQSCVGSGLDVEKWLADGLLDQVTLGGVGDHTPDASSDWWVERAHKGNCRVFPGIEGQLHWVPGSGGGGGGLHAGDGVVDGYGPPSMAYMRAVTSVHYMNGADGISLFNFTCADGPFALDIFSELAEPDRMNYEDKQYVAAMWPWDAQIYYADLWVSRFRLDPGQNTASFVMNVADEVDGKIRPEGLLTLDFMGINTMDDVDVLMNGVVLEWNGYQYNHYDNGCWNDIVQFTVPCGAMKKGENVMKLVRRRDYSGFAGSIQVRKCVLDLRYPKSFSPGLGIAGGLKR